MAPLWVAFEKGMVMTASDNAAEDEVLWRFCRVQELVFDAHTLTDHIVERTGRINS
jgi:hypothetical protein